MIHMRIVAPHDCSQQVLDMFCQHESVTNVVHLPDAAKRPHGDVILADVAREDASVIISDLRELEIPERGSIAIEEIDTEISEASRRADLAARSFVALAIGFPAGITVAWLCVLAFKATGASPDVFSESDHQFASIISSPDFFTFFVAFCAGVAGVLSL